MPERKANKYAVMLFLFAVFILLTAVTATWIYKMYKEQTGYAEVKTLETIQCGRYYFSVNPEMVSYSNGTLYFDIENTVGDEIKGIVVESSVEQTEINVSILSGAIQPISLPVEIDGWALVYPKGCRGANFKNLSFEK